MRIICNIACLISLLFLPWWCAALVVCTSTFAVRRFYEAVLYGIAFDALYATLFGIHGFPYAGTAVAVIFLFVSALLRKRLAW